MGDVVALDRAERRRQQRAQAKAAEKAAKAAPKPPPQPEPARIDLQDVHTILIGAAAWSVGYAPHEPGPARDAFRAACDRVATFLDLTLGWPPDPSPLIVPTPEPVERPSGLIIP